MTREIFEASLSYYIFIYITNKWNGKVIELIQEYPIIDDLLTYNITYNITYVIETGEKYNLKINIDINDYNYQEVYINTGNFILDILHNHLQYAQKELI